MERAILTRIMAAAIAPLSASERFVVQSTLTAITALRGLPKPESDRVRPA